VCPGDETIGAYVAGDLAAHTREDIEHHLDTCASCQELVAALARKVATTVGAAPGHGTRAGEPPRREVLGRYVIDGVLGSGGMGVVYRAHDPELGRKVALKVVRPHGDHDQTQARARLVREARAMAKIAHQNVIVVHDAGSVGDDVFIAMELVDGANLADWESAAPRPWREVVDVYLQAARGLAAAHRAGLVHRDFKPHNALIAGDGRVRVLDFGLARSVDDGPRLRPSAPPADPADAPIDASGETVPSPGVASADATLTRTGAIMGSPRFMSPEQHLGERADARTDQFSYCVALYHALYGCYPYAESTYAALSTAVTEREAAPAPRISKVPAAIGRVLARGLRRTPDDRFPSMDALATALSAAARRRRTRWIAAVAAIVVTALATAVVVLAARSRSSSSSPIAMAFSRNQQPVVSTGQLVGVPDLSPDGRWLAYATSTGISIRDLATGSVREIPDLTEVDGIRWSPLGDRVAVATKRGPVVVPMADGEPTPFPAQASTCRLAWSADATEILWGCNGPFGFKVLTVATGTWRPFALVLPDSEALDDFDWSSAGLVISTSPRGKVGRSALWTANRDGTHLEQLVEDELTSCVRWNARGDRFYGSRLAKGGTEIVYRDLGDPLRAVPVLVQPLAAFSQKDTFALSQDESDLIYVQRREWSDIVLQTEQAAPRALTADHLPKQALSITPDGRSIVFASGALETMALYRQPVAGGAPVKLSAPERFYIHMAIAPDGKRAAVTSLELATKTPRLSIVSLVDGSSRDLTIPPINLWWPVEWNPRLGIVLLAASDSNYVVIDPDANRTRALWPTDATVPLFNSAISPDGHDVAFNMPTDGGSALAMLNVADRTIRVLSPVSAHIPIAWSTDGSWIYTVEKASDERPRIAAVRVIGDGTSRLIAVGDKGSQPAVLPDGSGIAQVTRPVSVDLWLASRAPRETLPPGPPTLPPTPPTPPVFHPNPVNLALAGAAGTTPDGWVSVKATLSGSCGGPARCVELDGKTGSSISQYIDATAYRGRRVRVAFDARVDPATTLYVGGNSGVYTRTELPAGRVAIAAQKWTRGNVTLDVASDAIYIKVKAMIEGTGKAWIASLAIE